MKEYFVYILHCADDSYYIGITNDLSRRLQEHLTGISDDGYTVSRRPLRMVYYELLTDINMAIAREKQLNRWSRAKKEALISGDKELLKALAKGK